VALRFHHEQAASGQREALAISREAGDALALTRHSGPRHELARAHHGLANTYHAAGDLRQARHHWRHALTIYTRMGMPDAEDVRAKLLTLTQTPGPHAE